MKAFARHDDDPTDPTIKEVLEIRRSGFESIRTKKLELVYLRAIRLLWGYGACS